MQDSISKFNEAAQCLAPIIRTQVLKISDIVKKDVREIRIKIGVPVMIVCSCGTMLVGRDGRTGYIYNENFPLVTLSDVKETLNIICGYSLHSCQSSLLEGYVTIKGGHRVGVGARAVVENGVLKGIRDVAFLNIRIARQCKGVAVNIYDKFFNHSQKSIIVSGPPSSGKTTLLRDLSRLLSDIGGSKSYRTCVIDERDEIAAMYNGQPQNDVGINACVLSGFPKAEGILRAIRSLSPQVILCDEIGTNAEVEAISQGFNSGVSFVITIHSSSKSELVAKSQFRKLMQTGIFDSVIILDGGVKPCVIKEICKMEEFYNEIHRARSFDGCVRVGGQNVFNEN
ncbi:MAG: Flp pilus assembly complex ATPase component TadA [Clostridia bacterium]|nr:Flp pilus assembly complex ATPase component TadA [Clostridia bacterium]